MQPLNLPAPKKSKFQLNTSVGCALRTLPNFRILGCVRIELAIAQKGFNLMTLAKEQTTGSISNYIGSGFSITLKRLGELYEGEDDEDEYGILKPSEFAFKTALDLVVAAHSVMGNSFPKASACTDHQGGVSLTWTSVTPACKVRLFCPFIDDDEQLVRIYYRKNDEHGSEKVISATTLVDRLQWFNQA